MSSQIDLICAVPVNDLRDHIFRQKFLPENTSYAQTRSEPDSTFSIAPPRSRIWRASYLQSAGGNLMRLAIAVLAVALCALPATARTLPQPYIEAYCDGGIDGRYQHARVDPDGTVTATNRYDTPEPWPTVATDTAAAKRWFDAHSVQLVSRSLLRVRASRSPCRSPADPRTSSESMSVALSRPPFCTTCESTAP